MEHRTALTKSPFLHYFLFGVIFLFWENLISSLIGVYSFEIRRTMWGILYYGLLFLLFGGITELLTLTGRRVFPSINWAHQRAVWLIVILSVFLWGDITRQAVAQIFNIHSIRLSYLANLFVLPLFLLVGIVSNLYLARRERDHRLPSYGLLVGIYLSAILYTIISIKVTTVVFHQSFFTLHNLLLQPVLITASLAAISLMFRIFKSHAAFRRALIWVPLILCAVFVGISRIIPAFQIDIPSAHAFTTRPNIVIMLFDTLRADHVSATEDGVSLTPNIDALASRGKVYESCYATAPWTLPSVASMLTSRLPNKLGLINRGVLPEDVPTIADVLQRNGYYTAAVSANSHFSPRYGFGRSFDRFLYTPGSGQKQMLLPFNTFFPSPRWIDEIAYQFGFISMDLVAQDWETMNGKAFNIIEDVSSGPFFLYMHFIEPHAPYISMPFDEGILNPEQVALSYQFSDDLHQGSTEGIPDEDLHRIAETQHSRYTDGVQNVDQAVCEMVKELRFRGMADNTVLIVTADHGEEFLEHGDLGHKTNIYDEQIHVPLIIYSPRRLSIDLPDQKNGVSLVDLAPTIAEIAGDPGAMGNVDGRSLAQDWMNLPHPKYMMVDVDGTLWSGVIADPYKLILKEFTREGQIDTCLYNLDTDPDEQINLLRDQPQVADSLAMMLRYQLDQTIENPVRRGQGLSIVEKERLGALGYVN